MKKFNKKFFGIPLVAILVVVALLGIMGGTVLATANFLPRTLTGTGTLDITDSYGYTIDKSGLTFNDTTIFSNQSLSVNSDVATFTNDGNQIVTGFTLSEVTGVPVGATLSVTPNSGLFAGNTDTVP
jgi:hypothetical protein